MTNTELSSFYKGLLPVLWEELLFFIPENENMKEFLDNYDKFDFQKYRRKLMVLDYVKGPIIYEAGRDNSRAILKGATLKDNIHQLLNKKATSNKLEFDYVLELYFEQVECLFYICNWLNLNLTQGPPLNDTLRGLFQMQSNTFKTHLETLLYYFYPKKDNLPKGNFDLKKIIASHFPELSKKYRSKKLQVGKEKVLNKKKEPTLPPKKVEKRPLITEKEAETALLRQIFKIDNGI